MVAQLEHWLSLHPLDETLYYWMTIVPSMLPSPGFLAVRRQGRRNAFGRHQQVCSLANTAEMFP
jgi:hypothetical protein